MTSSGYLFRYAVMGLPAATASIHPLTLENPVETLLAGRLAKIALHELGHSLGLDHHSYEEGVDCVMIGDATVDCTETVDYGGILFCNDCASDLRKNLRH